MELAVYSEAGEVVGQIQVSEAVFGVPFNGPLVHQAVVAQQANARQGTVSTRGRSEVSGSGRKMYRQKGTGRARHGNRRAPVFRGGGVTFGPKPRSFRQALPRKMRRQAIRCALSAKVADEELVVVEGLSLEEPDTKKMAQILHALGAGTSALVVTPEVDQTVIRSSRNLPRVETTLARLLNVVDLLSHKNVVMTVEAVRQVEGWLGAVGDSRRQAA